MHPPATGRSTGRSRWLVSLVVAGILAQTLTNSALGSPLDPNEQAMFDLTNQSRQQQGLSALQFDPDMLSIARQRATDQGGPQLSHMDGGIFAYLMMLAQAGVDTPRGSAENLAYSYPWNPAGMQQAFLNSPLHRANIMQPDWTRMAVGAWSDPSKPGGDLAELYR